MISVPDHHSKARELVHAIPGCGKLTVNARRIGRRWSVTISGMVEGRSIGFSWRRRRRIEKRLTQYAARHGLTAFVQIQIVDAVSRFEESALSIATIMVHPNCSSATLTQVAHRDASLLIMATSDQRDIGRNRWKQYIRAIENVAVSGGIRSLDVVLEAKEPDSVSDLALLTYIRVHAPIDAKTLAHVISETKSASISVEQVQRQMDKIRRRGLLLVVGNRQVALSGQGLTAVPALRGRNSPDVRRAFALAGRRW